MNVLVTSIGSTTSIGVTKCIRALNRDIQITGTDTNSADTIAGSSLVDSFVKVPLNTEPSYLNEILKIVEEKNIRILIPIHDHEIEVLSKEIEKFKNLGCTVIVSSFSTVKIVNDKYTFAKILSDSNILTPKTYSIEEWEKLDLVETDFWIMKPLQGVSSRGIYKGLTNEIKFRIEKMGGNKNTYIIQPHIEGKEYTVDVFVKNKKAYCIVPRVREEVREGICYKAYTASNEKFCNPVNKIIGMYDFYGPINIQFIETDNNDLYCIECNPRFGGSTVTTLYAGINLFQFILDDLANKPLFFCNDYKSIYMTRYWTEIIYEN